MRFLLAVGLPLLAAVALGQVPPNTLLTSNRALLLGEPRAIVGQHVVQLSSSPSGRYLLVVREHPAADSMLLTAPRPWEHKPCSFALWDSQSGTVRDLAAFDKLDSIGLVEGYSPTRTDERYRDRVRIDWFVGADKAVVSVNVVKAIPPAQRENPLETEKVFQESYFLDAARGTFRRIFNQEQEGGISCRIVPSPVLPIAVKCHYETSDWRAETSMAIQTLEADGTWGPVTKIPSSVQRPGGSAWSSDGKVFQIDVRVVPEPGQRLAPRILRYDPAKREVETVIGPLPTYKPQPQQRDVELRRRPLGEDGGNEVGQPANWQIESSAPTERSSALVSVGAQLAHLPSKERFVAYVVDGVLFTRLIREATLRDYEAWRDQELKEDAIRRASQIAAAVSIFSAENDGALPTGSEIRHAIMEHTEGASVFDGFTMVSTYTNMSQVQDKSTAVLGYIQTRTGRAVIHLDRKVKWEDRRG